MSIRAKLVRFTLRHTLKKNLPILATAKLISINLDRT